MSNKPILINHLGSWPGGATLEENSLLDTADSGLGVGSGAAAVHISDLEAVT